MARVNTKNRRERRIAQRDFERMVEKLINRFYNTALSIFSWEVKGLSKYYNSYFSREIEHLLFSDGWCTVFRDPKDDIIKVGRIAGKGKLGQYRQFVEWSAIMGNGDHISGLNNKNAVIVYNNKSRIPTREAILDDIKNMIDTDISLKQHIKSIRVPFVFSGNEDDMLTFKTIYESVVDGEPVLFLDSESKAVSGEPFKVWNSDVDYKGDKLMMLYEAFENRVFTMLGIQSNRIDKQAQVGQTEVNKNDDVILVNFEAYKSERVNAQETIKEVLGVDVTLKINEYLVKQRHEGDQIKGGDENGKIYNDDKRD